MRFDMSPTVIKILLFALWALMDRDRVRFIQGLFRNLKKPQQQPKNYWAPGEKPNMDDDD
jgi:hypothetical protein